MRWEIRAGPSAAGTTSHEVRHATGTPLTRAEATRLLASDAAFRTLLVRALADAPQQAFFWECPPTSRTHQDRPFSFVLVDAPSLARTVASPEDFEPRFEARPSDDVLTFPNLGGDATLVVPAPRAEHAHYAHLAAFVRGAPAAQVNALLRALGVAIEKQLSLAPLWVSTAGLGVPWLHLRLDARPKYYRHAPFKTPP